MVNHSCRFPVMMSFLALSTIGIGPLEGTPLIMTDGPKTVVSGTVVEVGEVARGKRITHSFVIENTGTTDLEINAKPNCGCTLIESDAVIHPGQKSRMTVELKTAGLTGPFRKTVDVMTNDATLPKFTLVLTGKSIPAVQLPSAAVQFLQLKKDKPTDHEFVLKTIPGLEILSATASPDFAKVETERIDDRSFRLKLGIESVAPPGRHSIKVTLKTTAEFEPTVILTFYTEKGIQVSPVSFVFGPPRIDSKEPRKASVIIRKAAGNLRLLGVASNDPNITTEITTIKEGFLYRVTATAAADAKIFAELPLITVETDDPDQPRLEIPIGRPKSQPGLISAAAKD